MRLFLAVSLPGDLRDAALGLQASLKDAVGPASFTRPEAMHVTLRFLGEVDPARVPVLASALGPALADLAPVAVAMAGGGAFPDARRPRVLWVGLQDGGGLARIAARIEEVLGGLGFPPPDHPFRAHLTLARIRSEARGAGPHPACAREAAHRLSETGLLGRFMAQEVTLFASELAPSGAIHTPLASFPLEGGPAGGATAGSGGSAGRLIAVEGLDGSGGTTQVGLLAAALRARGLEVEVTGEPSHGPVGNLLRAVLRCPSEAGEAVLPYLFAADRRDHLDREILPALARGAWVISDRYLASSLAYQSLVVPFEHVSSMNARFPIPDLTILLALDPARCLERVARRGQARELFEDLDHLRAVETAYERALAWTEARGGPVARVEAGGTVEEVAGAVWRAVEARLPVP